MTDLVAELRKRAEPCSNDNPTADHPCTTGMGSDVERWQHLIYREAADLLEADPLYKAAPKMRDFLAEWVGSGHYIPSTRIQELRDLLAPLPKER